MRRTNIVMLIAIKYLFEMNISDTFLKIQHEYKSIPKLLK